MQRVKSAINDVFKKTGKSKSDACKAIKISRETLWRWSKDINQASLGDLVLLADYLGCAVTDLYVRE